MHIAIIGAGTIRLSWATLAAAQSHQVTISDPRGDLAEFTDRTIREFAGTDADDLLTRITVSPSIADAVSGADVVHKSGPERIELKRSIFAEIQAAATPTALLLSSTSGLLPTAIAGELADASNMLVAHPLNPPHRIPLVEVVPGERTSDDAVERTVEYLRGLGRTPVVIHKEVDGFVVNRLQRALFNEAVSLVGDGVVSADELDTIMTMSLGIRWSMGGPFLSFHLGGGPGGLRAHDRPPDERAIHRRGSGQDHFADRKGLRHRQLRITYEEARRAGKLCDRGARNKGDAHMSKHEPLEKISPDYLDADLFGYQGVLTKEETEIILKVRTFLQEEVAPRANEFWDKTESPLHLLPRMAELDIVGLGYEFEGRPAARKVLTGWLGMEFARVDPSTGTMFGVHSGLAMSSISILGSDEQRERWLPAMRRMEKIGAFGLSEPHGGSDVSGGLETTARREGDEWVLNGSKRWIGNGTFADLIIVFAKDEEDSEVKGFVVEKEFDGFSAKKIEGKYSLRGVQNADLFFDECRVPHANKLENSNSFHDTSKVLRLTRGGVAWSAIGVMMGAYERAVKYSQERVQFGKPIASFQLISDLIAKMAGNITACIGMALQVSELQDRGIYHDEHAALSKTYCTTRLREVVGWAREILGGNGILLEYDVIRFFADAEALYSYEGTSQMNNLIVGRGVTGFSAFV